MSNIKAQVRKEIDSKLQDWLQLPKGTRIFIRKIKFLRSENGRPVYWAPIIFDGKPQLNLRVFVSIWDLAPIEFIFSHRDANGERNVLTCKPLSKDNIDSQYLEEVQKAYGIPFPE